LTPSPQEHIFSLAHISSSTILHPLLQP
jgi:hypothetical protein